MIMNNTTELMVDTEILVSGGLVMSQMMFTVLGSLSNNLVLITLKDLPDMSASTYHVLLANLALTNLITCTLIKPASAVYIGYAHAKVDFILFLATKSDDCR